MQVRDAGSLLSGANFTLQTVDSEDMTLQYDSVADPISHLRVRFNGSAVPDSASPHRT